MVKNNITRRKGHNSHSRRKDCYVTFGGLKKWYEVEFEKLGWMILAKSKGMNEKITTYKHGVEHLYQCLEDKIVHTHSYDKKNDLHIMRHNVKILLDHIKKDF